MDTSKRGSTAPETRDLTVVRTSNRSDRYDYLVQLNSAVADQLGVERGGLVSLRYDGPELETQVQARLQVREDVSEDEVGIDFTLRYALGVAAVDDVEYSASETPDRVTVSAATNQESRLSRRLSNRILGVRPEVCRTRMAVHPDLENHICRLSENTMELIGIEEGDKVVIESPNGIVRGRKAFQIDDESRERKELQQQNDPDRYVDCYSLLDLDRIRETDVDIPEVYLDYEARHELGIHGKNNEGVCHPVRIYRDSYDQFLRLSTSMLAALLAAAVGASTSLGGTMGVALSVTAGLVAVLLLVFRSRRLLK